MKPIKTKVGKISTSQKISVGIMMVAGLMVASSFFAGLVLTPKKNAKVLSAQPLIINNIESAITNVTGVSAKAKFNRSNLHLGELSLLDNYYIDGYQMNTTTSADPLSVSLTADLLQGTTTVPAMILTLWQSENYTVFNSICIPETQVNLNPKKYYFDIQGTPYLDQTLTQAAISQPCGQVLARTLKIKNIASAITNIVGSKAIVTFDSNSLELGSLNLFDNNYNMGYNSSVVSPTPLRVELKKNPEENIVAVPAMILTLWGNEDDPTSAKTVCLPATEVSNVHKYYYYDSKGTPYLDSLLVRPAISQPCDQILARALKIKKIESALSNNPQYYNNNASATFYSNSVDLGNLMLTDNFFQKGDQVSEVSTPLQVAITSFLRWEVSTTTIPASIISVWTEENEIKPTTSICLPETLASLEPTNYFYDTNGTPYMDSLLTRPAISQPCNQILAKGLKIMDIVDASANDTGFDASAFYITDSLELGKTFLNDNYYLDGGVINYNPAGPFKLLMAGPFEGDAVKVPAMYLSLYGDKQVLLKKICFPGAELSMRQEKYYYYDVNGLPYSDSLLKNRLVCNVKSIPTNELAP